MKALLKVPMNPPMKRVTSLPKSAFLRGRASAPLLALLAFFSIGCGPEIPPVSELDKPRVLGIFYTADGEPERANPIAGETGAIHFMIGEPGPRTPVDILMIACPPAPISFGAPFCAGPPFATATRSSELSPFSIPIEIPDDERTRAARGVLISGAICYGGPLDLTKFEELFAGGEAPEELDLCADKEQLASLFAIEIAYENEDFPNLHPAPLEVLFEGEPLTLPVSPDEPTLGCKGRGIAPEVVADGEERVFILRGDPSSHDTIERFNPQTERTEISAEELQISRYASHGRVVGTYANMALGDDELAMRWETPDPEDEPEDAIDPSGELARFIFTVRDRRGGFASSAAALCLIPE